MSYCKNKLCYEWIPNGRFCPSCRLAGRYGAIAASIGYALITILYKVFL